MKSAVLISFLFLLVSIQTPIGQLFKIPLLIEHFRKHQRQDGVSLSDFLKDHYTKEHNDADWPEDEQLPFKTMTCYSIGYAIVPEAVRPSAMTALYAERNISYFELFVPQHHLSGIFHPPRA